LAPEPAAVTETRENRGRSATAPPVPRGSSPTPSRRQRLHIGRGWILLFVALLVFNFYVSLRATQPTSRVRVPYSRVEADDAVPDGDSRVRRQRRPVTAAPAEGGGRERRAARHGRPVVAEPAARIRAGAALHLPVVLADAARRQRPERARLVRTVARPAVPAVRRPRHVRGRRRHRRGEGGADGGRRLPAPSAEVPGAGRPDPARRAALRAPGHRQDAARARGRGRGGRAVLLDGGVRVRRGDRRRRHITGPRPLHAGEGGGAGDRVHRRARRDRPVTHLRRGRVQRRQRRARADAEPDPDRDGRLRLLQQRDRHRRDQPARRPRPGPASARPFRPQGRGAAARPRRPRGDPRGAHAGDAARAVRRPRQDRGDDAGHGRRGPRESGQRGCAPGGTAHHRASTNPTSPMRSSGSCSAPNGRC
jgi:hypothetical protein